MKTTNCCLVFPRSNFIGKKVRIFHATVFHGVELPDGILVHSASLRPNIIQPDRHLAVRRSLLNAISAERNCVIEPYAEERLVDVAFRDEDRWGERGWNEPEAVLRSLKYRVSVETPDYLKLVAPTLTKIQSEFECGEIEIDVGSPPFVEIERFRICRDMCEKYSLISMPWGHVVSGDLCKQLVSDFNTTYFVVRDISSLI